MRKFWGVLDFLGKQKLFGIFSWGISFSGTFGGGVKKKFMKILYQGSPGAYSHIAALEVYPNAKIIPCKTFDECFTVS